MRSTLIIRVRPSCLLSIVIPREQKARPFSSRIWRGSPVAQSLESVDSVCDKRGDEGVDGILLNDKRFTVRQSKINQGSDTAIGDASLRPFAVTILGSRSWSYVADSLAI
jgi:hypothetical protein